MLPLKYLTSTNFPLVHKHINFSTPCFDDNFDNETRFYEVLDLTENLSVCFNRIVAPIDKAIECSFKNWEVQFLFW